MNFCEHKQKCTSSRRKQPLTDARVHSYGLTNASRPQSFLSVSSNQFWLLFLLSFLYLSPPLQAEHRRPFLRVPSSLKAVTGRTAFLTDDERQTYRESIHFLETGARLYLHSAFLCLCWNVVGGWGVDKKMSGTASLTVSSAAPKNNVGSSSTACSSKSNPYFGSWVCSDIICKSRRALFFHFNVIHWEISPGIEQIFKRWAPPAAAAFCTAYNVPLKNSVGGKNNKFFFSLLSCIVPLHAPGEV